MKSTSRTRFLKNLLIGLALMLPGIIGGQFAIPMLKTSPDFHVRMELLAAGVLIWLVIILHLVIAVIAYKDYLSISAIGKRRQITSRVNITTTEIKTPAPVSTETDEALREYYAR